MTQLQRGEDKMEVNLITPAEAVRRKLESLNYITETVNKIIVEKLVLNGSACFTFTELDSELVKSGLPKIPSTTSPQFIVQKFTGSAWEVSYFPGGPDTEPSISFAPKTK